VHRSATLAILIALTLPATSGLHAQDGPPETRRIERVDRYHGTTVADPYRWLERMDSEAVREWYGAQDDYTRRLLARVPLRAPIRDRLSRLVAFASYSAPLHRGDRYFYTFNDGGQGQAAVYVIDDVDGEGRLVLDPNAASDDGSLTLRLLSPSVDGSWLAYGLSRRGSYWADLRIRNVDSGADAAEVLQGVNTRFANLAWRPGADGFFYGRFAAPEPGRELQATVEHHKVYFHRVGTPQAHDVLVYERPDHPDWLFASQVTEDGRYLVLTVRAGSTIENRIFYKDLADPTGEMIELIPEDDALYSFLGNDGPVFWFHTDREAPRGRVVAVDVRSPERWRTLIGQSDAAIQYVNVVGDHFIVMYVEDALHKVKVFDLDGDHRYDLELPGLGSVWGGFTGNRSDPLAFYRFNGLADPGTVYRLDVASGVSEIFRRPDLPFDPSDFVTRQVFFSSADGTRVPMFIAHRRDLERDGTAPAFMYGYGAFGWSAMPWYQPHWLVWMEMGGVYALPNVRGGGEYGEEWHEAGMKTNKHHTVEDYIAAAEWLAESGYTSAGRIVANGGSASAPLAAIAAIRRPDLFGAALLDVPTLDMLRFTEWTGGQRLIPEYGDPRDPREFQALLEFSPYHNLREGTCYPATLIAASERDEVAPPAHAYKFAAALQHAQGCDEPVLLRIAWEAGHTIGATAADRVEGWADELAFLVKALDLRDPLGEATSSSR